MSTNAINTDATLGFVRLSPWAILHFAARTIVQLVGNAFALIPAVYGVYRADSSTITYAAIGAGVALVLLSASLKYFYFSYLVQDSSVQVKQGVFSKKQLNLQFHRVQNVNIEHPFYFRPLGLVTVKIDSAGSASEEAYLPALTLDRAQNIADEIRQRRRSADIGDAAHEANAEPTAHPSELLLTRSLGDLVIHGLTNNRAWIIMGAVGAGYGQLAEPVNAYLVSLGLDGIVTGSSITVLIVIGISALMLAVMIMAALSVLGSIFSYYKFELFRSDEAFMVRRGLLTRHEINLKKSRIQALWVRRDWLDMILGRMNVVFEQISHNAGGSSGFALNRHVMVPSVEPHHADRLADDALSAVPVEDAQFTAVSRRYFVRLALILLIVYGLPVSILVNYEPLLAVAGAGLFALHLIVTYMRWRRWGLAIDNGIVVVRKGVFGVDHIVMPAFKMQEVERLQTPLMRRHGLSSIQFTVASRTVSVPFLPDDEVRAVLSYCLYETEATDRSWM